jgi:two-component system phosphate regulon sensor histidine kinase PhoR
MNRTAIWAIVILMSAAMIGVAAIQMYWINFSIRLDEKKFDERVFSAMKRVEERVTKTEEENADWSMINSSNTFGYPNIGKPDISDVGARLSVDSLSLTTGSYSEYDSWRKKIFYYELKSIQHRISVPSLDKRIDPSALGMMIKQELSNRGIDLRYDYGVFDHSNNDFIVINDNYTVQIGDNPMVSTLEDEDESPTSGIYDSKYTVDLFPSEEGAPGALMIYFPNKTRWLWGSVWPLLLSSLLFMTLILLCFAYTIYVIFRQKKVGEMKTDFINNMTHEFKTPIATISLAVDSIVSPMILNDSTKVSRFAGIIKQENKRMLSQVEKVLQMALIDKDDFRLKMTFVNLHDIINQAVSNMELQVRKREGNIVMALTAGESMIEGDPTHLSNIIHNLLDNANKYTPEKPLIQIVSKNVPNGIEVSVTDNGIGLSNEAKKQVFDKFYRVHTGNLHDVKGFGLGLSYVKTMVTAHKGSIEVESEPGEGSTFTLFFPFRQNSELEQR